MKVLETPRRRLRPARRWYLIACPVLVAWAVWWSRPDSPERAWNGIEASIGAHQWAEAEVRLRRWLARSPTDGRSWLKLGAVLTLRGREDDAFNAWRHVDEADPAWPHAQIQIGEIWMKRRELTRAEAAFRAAGGRLPEALDPRRRLVYLLTIEQRTDEARAVLRELYRRTQDLHQLVTLVGLSAPADPNRRDDQGDLEPFLEKRPDDPWLRRARGIWLVRQGRAAEARPYLESSASALEHDPAGRVALAECLLAAGETDGIDDALGPIPEDASSLASWWQVKGDRDETLGRLSGAVENWRRALEADPENRAVHYRVGQALIRLGRDRESRTHLDRAEAIRIREVVLIQSLDRVLRGARDPRVFESIAGLCQEAGLLMEARAWYDEAIRIDPTLASAQTALASLTVPELPRPTAPRLRSALVSIPKPESVSEPSCSPRIRFEDHTKLAGIDYRYESAATGNLDLADTMGGGVGLIDFDGDGWLDLYFVNGCPRPVDPSNPPAPNRLFRNRRDGTFEDVTSRAGVAGRGYGMGCAVGDYDNDGHDDLFVTGLGHTVLYRNRGDGTFEDVTSRAGVESSRWTTAAGFGDLDGDADLDLVVVTYVTIDPANVPECLDPLGKPMHCPPGRFPPEYDLLYRNNGDGTFTDVSRSAGLEVPGGTGLGLAIADLDDDGRLDLFVANDASPNFYFRNLGDLKFEEIGVTSGLACDGNGRATASMGVVAADLDGDGRLDLFHTNFLNEPNTLARNLGGGLFLDATARSGLDAPSRPVTGFGTAALDADNDGRLDLFVANGHVDDRPWIGHPMAQLPQFYRSVAAGRYELETRIGPYFNHPTVGRGLAAGDLDNDGRVDLVVVHRDAPAALLRNTTPSGHWLGLSLRGGRSGVTPVGARVTCRVRGSESVRWLTSGTSYLGSHDPRLWFGLGGEPTVEKLEVRWPSGAIQTFAAVAADRILQLREGEGLAAATIAPAVRPPEGGR